MAQNDQLRLRNQLCHPIYSASNALTRIYKPLLEPLGITYPQYLILMALWEQDGINLNAISEQTFFDSGTLTPLIKKLEKSGLIQIKPDENDRRNKIVYLTAKGNRLKTKAAEVPKSLSCLVPFSRDDAQSLVKLVRSLHEALLAEEARTSKA